MEERERRMRESARETEQEVRGRIKMVRMEKNGRNRESKIRKGKKEKRNRDSRVVSR